MRNLNVPKNIVKYVVATKVLIMQWWHNKINVTMAKKNET